MFFIFIETSSGQLENITDISVTFDVSAFERSMVSAPKKLSKSKEQSLGRTVPSAHTTFLTELLYQYTCTSDFNTFPPRVSVPVSSSNVTIEPAVK